MEGCFNKLGHFKFIFLVIGILCLFGCDAKWSDVQGNYGDVLAQNPTCNYISQSKDPIQGIQEIQFNASSSGATATYELSGKGSVTEQFFVNDKFINTHEKTGIPFYYDVSVLNAMLDKYRTDSSCLDNIYLCAESGISGFSVTTAKTSETSCYAYMRSDMKKTPTETPTEDDKHVTSDGCETLTNKCLNADTVYCKTQAIDDLNENQIIIERGENKNGDKYLWLYPYGATNGLEAFVGDPENNFFIMTPLGDTWEVSQVESVFKKDNCEYPNIYYTIGSYSMNGVQYFIQAEGENPIGSFPSNIAKDYDPTPEYYRKDENVGDANNVLIGNVSGMDVCSQNGVKNVLHVIGYLIFAVKIAVPLLLVVMGSIDFAQALTASDDKAMKDATAKLIKRVIAGIIVFFIPTILNFGLGLVDGISDNQTNFTGCSSCLFTPFDGNCTYTKIGEKK